MRPPALARRLLALTLPAAMRDDVLANLDDLHQLRASQHGQRSADAWYWRQALSTGLRLRADGLTPSDPHPRRRTPIMRTLGQDLRFTWRLYRAKPTLALVIIGSLALGIGLNSAIFSIVDGVLLRAAPVAAFDRLVMVWETDRNTGTTREPASIPDFIDYRERATTVDRLAGVMAGEANFTPPGGVPSRLAALRVSHDFLPMLGLEPIAGRAFTADDDQRAGPAVVIISESLWRRALDADPAVAGRPLHIDDTAFTVVGVVPDVADFGVMQLLGAAAYSRSFADRGMQTRVDLWLPLQPNPETSPRSSHPMFMVGRLKAGVPLADAQDEFVRIAADLEASYPSDNEGRGAHVEAMSDVVFGPVRPALLALWGAVIIVLLVACVNVANLMLVHGASRRREIALRSALGAGARRLTRQMLTEALALSVIAGLIGLALAYGAVAWVASQAPPEVPRLSAVAIDLRVLAMTFALSLGVGLLFGSLPAIEALKTRPRAALDAENGRTAGGGGARRRLRLGLVIAELAFTVVLVVSAGLMIRSVQALGHIDPGFEAANVMKAELQLPRSRYPTSFAAFPDFAEMHQFTARLLERTAALPGVEAVAVAGNHPLDPGFVNSFAVAGREAEADDWPEISVRRVTPGYFDTVGARITRGRGFLATDGTRDATVSLINEATAARFFQDQDPIGQHILLWGARRRIVGVVANERFQGIAAGEPIAVYLPLSQAPSFNGSHVLLVRTAAGRAPIGAELQRIVQDLDPALATFGVEPLDQTMARNVAEQRFTMVILATFAGLGLLLAAVGVYGVLSYGVAQQRREIGIRLALGADPRHVVRGVVGEGLALALGGTLIGIVLALGVTRVLEALLFAVTPTDPVTFVAVAGVLLAVAVVASYLPARRATRVAPIEALR